MNHQRGAVLVFFAVFLVLLVGMAFACVNFGFLTKTKRELRLTAEAAALAGASQLCATKICFERARESAVESVSQHRVQGSLGSDKSFSIRETSPEADGITWDRLSDRGFKVVIERGWVRGGNFESMEQDWQAEHPGVVRHLTANAVRVKLLRPSLRFISIGFGSKLFTEVASAVAVRGFQDETPVVPFAIPACALLNSEGETYSKGEICRAERYFSRSDRYGIESGDYQGVSGPSFGTQPCSSTLLNAGGTSEYGQIYFKNQDSLNFWTTVSELLYIPPASPSLGAACALIHGDAATLAKSPSIPSPLSPSFTATFGETVLASNVPRGFGGKSLPPQPVSSSSSEYSDLFGVVGLPDHTLGDIESRITERFQQDRNPTWNARLGSSFSVLANGLQNSDLDQLVWNAISNSINGVELADNLDSHPRLEETVLENIEREYSTFIGAAAPIGISSSTTAKPCSSFQGSNDPNCKVYPFVARTSPALNKDNVEWLVGIDPRNGLCNSHWSEVQDFSVQNWNGGTISSFWARADFKLRAGIDNRTRVWKVQFPVIADYSAGAAACSVSSGTDPVLDGSHETVVVGFVPGLIYDVDIGKPTPEIRFQFNAGRTHRVAQWGFKESCNVVRARIDCGDHFIPSGESNDEATVKIVESSAT